jgi:hypothetical protein
MDIEYRLSVRLVERNVLEAELEAEELEESAEYQKVQQQITDLKAKLDAENSGFTFETQEQVGPGR